MNKLLILVIILIIAVLFLNNKEQFYYPIYHYNPNALINANQNMAAINEAEDISAGLQYGY